MHLSPEDRPAGGGAIFLTIKQNDRIGIATTIERLIDMLDAMDGDPDFEPYLADSRDDREAENEHGGDICDEPHDSADEGDDEPSLGWTAAIDQRRLNAGDTFDVDLEGADERELDDAQLDEPGVIWGGNEGGQEARPC